MSALRQRLKKPELYLVVLAVIFTLLCVDTMREPQKQWSARGYLAAIHFYQRNLSSRLGGKVECRFEPTCSHYSEQAVERYGIGRGLRLTASRLSRCRSQVKAGTTDPVPQNVQAAQK